MAGRAPRFQMRSRKASEAKPRSPTIHPGTSGRQPSSPGARGSSCACPGASAKAMARPRPSAITQVLCRSRRESGQAPRARLALGCRPPFFRARRLVVSPDIGAIEEGHAKRDVVLLGEIEQALPDAPLRPADEQLCCQPPRTQLSWDAAPLRAVLVPPENRRDRPAQLFGRVFPRGRTASISGSQTAHAVSVKI